MNVELTLTLPRDAQTIALVRSLVAVVLAAAGVDDDCIDDVRLALSEATANVIEHAAVSGGYVVRIEVDDAECLVSVRDAVTVFESVALARTMPDAFAARGRGVAIMQAVTDGFDLTSAAGTGTVVCFVKRLALTPGGPLATLGFGGTPSGVSPDGVDGLLGSD